MLILLIPREFQSTKNLLKKHSMNVLSMAWLLVRNGSQFPDRSHGQRRDIGFVSSCVKCWGGDVVRSDFSMILVAF